MSAPVVAVTDVFVAYAGAGGPVMALRGADLTLAAGERLLVTGPNGSGKSTLLRVVTGDQPVLAGRVEVGGAAVHAMSPAARRRWQTRAVGSVDQHARRNLLPELDVLDNVALQLRLTATPRADARDLARDTLDRLGLAGLAAADVGSLSGGEAQRVALCAAVAHGPALLLADEPTGELDDAAARQVFELLEAVAAAGTGVILVSHDARAAGFVDRAVRLRDGRLAEQWTPGSATVEQVPDSRGWVRLPVEPAGQAAPPPGVGYVVEPLPEGLLLRPGRPGVTGPGTAAVPSAWTSPEVVDRESAAARLVDVAAGYGDRVLFDRLTLDLVPGRLVAVRGPSGAGKSTLLALVAGLLDARAGEVSVGGTAWAGLDRPERAAHRGRWLALAPQRPALVEPMTVRENLGLAAELRGRPVPSAALLALAQALGLAALLDGPVSTLSGGERQRAALARAVVTPAPLLVLDEPTSQQDDGSAARVVRVVRDAVARGRAVLVASHDPALLGAADQVVELDAPAPVTRAHTNAISPRRAPGRGRAAGRRDSRR